jgi:hypothetical protein
MVYTVELAIIADGIFNGAPAGAPGRKFHKVDGHRRRRRAGLLAFALLVTTGVFLLTEQALPTGT